MNKGLIAGGLMLIGGGLAYWYFLQQNGNGVIKCSDYTNQSVCEANGCYWCDGQCQSTPCGQVPCTLLPPGTTYGYPIGWQKCEIVGNNLCEWDGTNWVCIEPESELCINNQTYKKCYNSTNTGYPTCESHPGTLTDRCTTYGQGCVCNNGLCQPNTQCDYRDNKCRLEAWEYGINANDLTWACEQIPGAEGAGNICEYPLDNTYFASKLNGIFKWKWGFPTAPIWLVILGTYEGESETSLLWEKTFTMWSTNGEEIVDVTFNGQGITSLLFITQSMATVNVKPESFIGTLDY